MNDKKNELIRARLRLTDNQYPKPVADWLQPTDYPGIDSFSAVDDLDPLFNSKSWAWEFLRRNERYQRTWDDIRRSRRRDIGLNTAAEFGLITMIPFGNPSSGFIPFSQTLALPTLNPSRPNSFLANSDESALVVALDLRRPLKHQLTMLRSQFAEEQRRRKIKPYPTGRKRIDVFTRYLRILDAKASGATNQVIACQFIEERIYSGQHRASDIYYAAQSLIEQDASTAKRLANSGYLELIHS